MVVLYKSALTLIDGDLHDSLLVLSSGEGLGLLSGNCGSSRDDLRHDTTLDLNTKSQRSHINKQDSLGLLGSLTAKNPTLDGSTVCHCFVGIDTAVRFLPVKEFSDKILDLWYSS